MKEEREWVLEAEKLVETFRETRNLFLTSRVSRLVALIGRISHVMVHRRTCHSEECFLGVTLPDTRSPPEGIDSGRAAFCKLVPEAGGSGPCRLRVK